MANTQTYEKIIKVKNARTRAKLISALLFYIIYILVWIFAGILNPKSSMLIFLGGALSCLLIVLITWKYLFVEFEYSFCQGTLSISKIYGKRKRKELLDADLHKLLFIAQATDDIIANAEQRFKPESRLIAVSSEYTDNIWLLVTGEENEPSEFIFIEADERILSILKSSAPFAFSKKF